MGDEPNIAELAVAAWRLERWLDNLNAERKMAAKKSLREIKKYLEASGIEIVDPVGWKFDPGLAIEVVNNEADDVDESELIVVQTNAPIIKKDGGVIQYGKVILGLDIKEQKANRELRTEKQVEEGNMPATETEEKTVEETELKQSKLYVNGDHTCWIKCFDCKAMRDGYQAVIVVESNTNTSVEIMDEQVYEQFCKGIPPRSPFRYTARAGAAFVALPYPDIWYVLVCPPKDHYCDEYDIMLSCEWMKIEDIQRSKAQTEKKKQEQPADNKTEQGTAPETIETSSEGQNAEQNPPVEDIEIPVTENVSESVTVSGNPEAEQQFSEEEVKRLHQQNVASYNKVIAMSKGLISNIHGKGGKKKR